MGPDSVGAMMDQSQPDFLQTALDLDLLRTPFRVQTNWHVISGAPSCGKTTLIDLLARKGYQTVPEQARAFMESEIGRGRTIILQECFHHRYASVFILDCLPTDLDGLRFDDDALPIFLDSWQTRDYHTLGYRVVKAPVLSPEARLAFVIENLEGQGLL